LAPVVAVFYRLRHEPQRSRDALLGGGSHLASCCRPRA